MRVRVPAHTAAWANGKYPLVYSLLLSGATTRSATAALNAFTCGYKATADPLAALTSAMLIAYGAEGAQGKLERGFIGARSWKDGKCVKPANAEETTCECIWQALLFLLLCLDFRLVVRLGCNRVLNGARISNQPTQLLFCLQFVFRWPRTPLFTYRMMASYFKCLANTLAGCYLQHLQGPVPQRA